MSKKIVVCRKCLLKWEDDKIPLECPNCFSKKLIGHRELNDLNVAHLDCDSFYASIEKRDNKELEKKPVVVGGSQRGVVAAACYVSRKYGIRSAMPIFKAKKLCPEIIIIRPRMEYYITISRKIRSIMETITPLIQPVSIDEAFLDLSGTEKLHKNIPAISLIKLQKRIFKDIGITVSVGLSYNKSLAKLASEQKKPNGFFVLGRDEASDWLSKKPISIIYGLGTSTVKKLNNIGVFLCNDLLKFPYSKIEKILGGNTNKILSIAFGIDERPVVKDTVIKSISVETTFTKRYSEKQIKNELHLLCQKLSNRLKDKSFLGKTLTLKLKTSNFKTLTRTISSKEPFQMAHHLFSNSEQLLEIELKKEIEYRLIGVGVSNLINENENNQGFYFNDQVVQKKNKLERALDDINQKIGSNSTNIGRHFTNN